jgi:hypothetical protein
MLRFSIRDMLLAFVGLAIVFAIAAALQRAGEREVAGRCRSNMHLVNLAILGYQSSEQALHRSGPAIRRIAPRVCVRCDGRWSGPDC